MIAGTSHTADSEDEFPEELNVVSVSEADKPNGGIVLILKYDQVMISPQSELRRSKERD